MAKLLGMLVTVTLLFFPSQDAGGASAAVQSQGQPSDPSFDVASVKLNTSGPGPRFARPLAGGQFSAVNMPLSDLIQFAYGLRGVEFRVVGAPAWASSTSYDVTARVDSNRVGPAGAVSMDDTRAMTRSLLRDRFTLIAHMESRELPIYALVKAHADGRLGARLQPSGSVCPPITLPPGIPAPPPPPGPSPLPGSSAAPDWNCTGVAMPGHMFFRKTTMARFADALSIFVRRVVVDRTGLDGLFDLDLDYVPDPAIAQQGIGGRSPGAPVPGVETNAAELFTALQEQVGLKLESTRGQVDVLVIDHVEKPAEN